MRGKPRAVRGRWAAQMLVFWKEKLVYLAVPKTGSMALEGALAPFATAKIIDPPILKHSPWYRYNRFLRPFFEDVGGQTMETLAVVREPIDWLGSWYRYRSRPDLSGHPNSTANISFDEFVLGYMKGKRPAFAQVGSQAKFLEDADGKCAVTHVFKYENQAGLKAFLEQRLGRTFEMKTLNVSPQRDFALSPGVERRLRRKMKAEFDTWDAAR